MDWENQGEGAVGWCHFAESAVVDSVDQDAAGGVAGGDAVVHVGAGDARIPDLTRPSIRVQGRCHEKPSFASHGLQWVHSGNALSQIAVGGEQGAASTLLARSRKKVDICCECIRRAKLIAGFDDWISK